MVKAAILICTCDRPDLLKILLESLSRPGEAEVPICIVDNGAQSSEVIATSFRPQLAIQYRRVAAPGLAAARNAGLRLALEQSPAFIAFIDDDEYPAPGWLSGLVRVMEETGGGFATGPVIPDFAHRPPAWATKGAFFHNTGNSFCTSNLIVRASILPVDEKDWFHADLNFIGGEDNELLSRLVEAGAAHVIAQDAAVHEYISEARLKRRYVWRRGLRDGMSEARIVLLRHHSLVKRTGALIGKCLRKLGYALNHLVWSPFEPWRLNAAMADLCFIAGIVLGACGVEARFYGRRPANG
ncbi:glycosyltransferase family 2 protein [Aestuariivirga sp.]|uniref:glycosyltransferase family 2 protein n=1 Tax=Aestuariivirga sp. TaxID=2650926 RepID=UPI003BA9AB74